MMRASSFLVIALCVCKFLLSALEFILLSSLILNLVYIILLLLAPVSDFSSGPASLIVIPYNEAKTKNVLL